MDMKAKFTVTAKFLDSNGIVTEKHLIESEGTRFVLTYIEPYTRKKVTVKQLYKSSNRLVVSGSEYLNEIHGNNDYDSFLIVKRLQ